MVTKRKRVLKLILPAAVLLVFSASLQAADVTRIMPLGDSITRGYTGSAFHWGYRKPLYDNLTTGGYSFDFVGSVTDGNFPDPNHEGHDGWRADQILTYIGGWLITYQPDVVLLHIGTNDITQGNQDANEVNGILNVIDAYEANNNKHVPVILALIINRTDSSQYSQATTLFNDDVNAMALGRIASGDDIIIVDMESAISYPADLADAMHPNDTGYAKMAAVWYNALADCLSQKTLTTSSTMGGSVIQPGEGTFQYEWGAEVNLVAIPDLGYYFANWAGSGVDAGRVVDSNSAATTITIDANYTIVASFGEDCLEEVDHRLELRTGGTLSDFASFYTANGWSFDTSEDFALKIDFHYGDVSAADGWTGMSVGDDSNYVLVSVGSDGDASYYYYEAVVDGNVVSEQEPRTSDDGTLYVSYNSASKKFYLSHTGFGSGNAYDWQASNPTQGQWSLPVDVVVGGGSTDAALGPGKAYLDNFEMQTAGLLGWPPITDIDGNGFIELDDLVEMCENWLESGAGDVDTDGDIDFYDFAEFGPAW
jgi:lysophospholipase L1-like esterase